MAQRYATGTRVRYVRSGGTGTVVGYSFGFYDVAPDEAPEFSETFEETDIARADARETSQRLSGYYRGILALQQRV